jgi:hypothetical protein
MSHVTSGALRRVAFLLQGLNAPFLDLLETTVTNTPPMSDFGVEGIGAWL